MTKFQWIVLILNGLIFIGVVNYYAAKRDAKMLSIPPQSEAPIYKQLPVIPFAE